MKTMLFNQPDHYPIVVPIERIIMLRQDSPSTCQLVVDGIDGYYSVKGSAVYHQAEIEERLQR